MSAGIRDDTLLEDAERIENWAVIVVIGAITIEGLLVFASNENWFFKIGDFIASGLVAIAILIELKFGGVVAGVLRSRLTKAEEETAQLRRRALPRHLPPDQIVPMAAKLKPFAGMQSAMCPIPHNTEAELLARQVFIPLEIANVPVYWQTPTQRPLWPGGILILFSNGNADSKNFADALCDALEECGLFAQVATVGTAALDPRGVHIIIGEKEDPDAAPVVAMHERLAAKAASQ